MTTTGEAVSGESAGGAAIRRLRLAEWKHGRLTAGPTRIATEIEEAHAEREQAAAELARIISAAQPAPLITSEVVAILRQIRDEDRPTISSADGFYGSLALRAIKILTSACIAPLRASSAPVEQAGHDVFNLVDALKRIEFALWIWRGTDIDRVMSDTDLTQRIEDAFAIAGMEDAEGRWDFCSPEQLASPASPDDGWMPIASAPKDGTYVLVYRKRPEGPDDVQSACWDRHLGVWRFLSASFPSWYPPTHWRPLLSPPSAPEAEVAS